MPTHTNNHYDLIVVGGGIHGVGVAQCAAAFGFSVLLLEKNTFASGTSSRSSKLIHGGLRYLESGQLRVVRACLAERQRLLHLAPDLVKLTPHYIPIYRHTSRRPWKIRVGLTLYQLLGGYHTATSFQTLPKAQWHRLDNIQQQDLQAVFQYWDAQTDDAQLTKAVAHSARLLGAECCEHTTLVNATCDAHGVQCCYRSHAQTHSVQAHMLINAAGPWVNDVLRRISPTPTPLPVELVQGAHLVLDNPPPRGVYYVESPQDQRAVFIMPWRNDRMLVGTTETPFNNDLDRVTPFAAEITYLQETLSMYFPDASTTPIEAFAGLRVLPASDRSPFSRSRETLLHPDNAKQPQVLTIYGGKLTEYRRVAEQVLRTIRPFLPIRAAIARTDALPLYAPD